MAKLPISKDAPEDAVKYCENDVITTSEMLKEYNERTHDGDLDEEEETIFVFITTQQDPVMVTGKRVYWMLEPDSTGINVYTIWSYKKASAMMKLKWLNSNRLVSLEL